jgi:hypothetical protein
MRTRALVVQLSALLLAVAATSCAPSTQPKADAPTDKPEKRRGAGSGSYEGQIGGLNHEAVEAKFMALQRSVERCLGEGTERVSNLGGTFDIAVRIRHDGSLRWAFMAESTLGDRATEACILEAARNATWPKPLGGEGEANHSFTIDSSAEVHTWKSSKLKGSMLTIRKKMWKCIGKVRGRFTATVYVRADGGVAAAGVSPPNADAEDQSDCVVEVIRGFNFGRQRRRLSKVTFRI